MYEHDAAEEAFKNGAEYMRRLILEKLYDEKRTAIGKDRFCISVIIEKVEKVRL